MQYPIINHNGKNIIYIYMYIYVYIYINIYICITESLCYTAVINTTLKSTILQFYEKSVLFKTRALDLYT